MLSMRWGVDPGRSAVPSSHPKLQLVQPVNGGVPHLPELLPSLRWGVHAHPRPVLLCLQRDHLPAVLLKLLFLSRGQVPAGRPPLQNPQPAGALPLLLQRVLPVERGLRVGPEGDGPLLQPLQRNHMYSMLLGLPLQFGAGLCGAGLSLQAVQPFKLSMRAVLPGLHGGAGGEVCPHN